MAQYAENVFFGKPCGLMDQMASSVGAVVAIDFNDFDIFSLISFILSKNSCLSTCLRYSLPKYAATSFISAGIVAYSSVKSA